MIDQLKVPPLAPEAVMTLWVFPNDQLAGAAMPWPKNQSGVELLSVGRF